ncbi:MAG: FkbM family methyltransferase [Sulfuricurvum sp.]|jgi:FkbM family methyltransferase
MIQNCNNTFYNKVEQKGFRPAHVAEVGVWHPQTSNIYKFIIEGVKTTLVEPDPASIELIKNEFKDKKVTLYEVAICDFNGKVDLCKRESSTFISSLSSSPALVNDNCKISETETFTANAKLFNEIDDGSIDLISIDTEGSEWFVIKNMVSRPAIISLETHGGIYTNPYMMEIQHWMDKNKYVLWYVDNSDSVYVLDGSIPITVLDKINLVKSKTFVFLKYLKKRLSKKIRRFLRKK